MAFDDLKRKLGNVDDNYLQAPFNIPGTDGLDPSVPPQSFLGQTLNKTLGVGDDVKTADSVEPVSSPIDLLAGNLGSNFGEALAGDAGEVVGNDIGAINFGKGVIDKTDKDMPIGRVFQEATVPPKPDYGKVIVKEQHQQPLGNVNWKELDPELEKLLNIFRGNK